MPSAVRARWRDEHDRWRRRVFRIDARPTLTGARLLPDPAALPALDGRASRLPRGDPRSGSDRPGREPRPATASLAVRALELSSGSSSIKSRFVRLSGGQALSAGRQPAGPIYLSYRLSACRAPTPRTVEDAGGRHRLLKSESLKKSLSGCELIG